MTYNLFHCAPQAHDRTEHVTGLNRAGGQSLLDQWCAVKLDAKQNITPNVSLIA